MPKKPLIYPDTELGNARKTLFEMLPEDLQNKSFGDIAWEWGYSGSNVVTSFFSPTASVGTFSVDNAHETIMQHVENTEAKSDEVRRLLEVVYKHSPQYAITQERLNRGREYPNTDLGNLRRELFALLPAALRKQTFTEIAAEWKENINTIVSLFSENVAIRTLSKKTVNRLVDKFPEENRDKAKELLLKLYEIRHPDLAFPKDELEQARKTLFDLFAEKLEVSHPSEIASKTTIPKHRLQMILDPKNPPTRFNIKDAHDMIMEELELPEEKSEEVLQLLSTIRSYAGKQVSQKKGQ